ncbi:MAG: hypothetical protein LBJ62_01695 [Bifidobacteriaceae bacterium]|jgi:hypothetical protein|nr:hypothetical protein [Bifidobacteriaceae bacterium]
MYRRLLQHHQFVAAQVAGLRQRRLAGQDTRLAGAGLALYHDRQTRHFQHERLIHLLVTLFFGGLLLATMAAWAVLALTPADPDATIWVSRGLGLACLVIALLEGFYLRHYYQLENGVQRLYGFDQDLAELSGDLVGTTDTLGPPQE